MELSPEDLIIDAYAESGPSGNIRRAVRVTHKPTGTVVLVDECNSQADNKAIALARLRDLLERPSA